jgi:hypothetical protein
MAGLAGIALGAAPVLGGALLGSASGQLRARDVRDEIKRDLELLERLPEDQVIRRAALRRSIDDRIDDLITAMERRRQLRAAVSDYEGNWRDIFLMLCAVMFTIVWWNVDHHRTSWLPLFVAMILASVVAAGYAFRGLRLSVLGVFRRRDRRRRL